MLDITGAGAQLPMRSHWKLRPGPQSHKNSEQQCKRIRANTASSNAGATGQAQSQQTTKQAPQGKRPSNRSSFPRSPPCSIYLAVLFEGGEGACSAAGESFQASPQNHPPPPSRSPPVKRECRCAFVLTSRAASPKRRSTSRAVCLTQAGGATRGRRAWAARAGGAGGRRKRAARAGGARGWREVMVCRLRACRWGGVTGRSRLAALTLRKQDDITRSLAKVVEPSTFVASSPNKMTTFSSTVRGARPPPLPPRHG